MPFSSSTFFILFILLLELKLQDSNKDLIHRFLVYKMSVYYSVSVGKIKLFWFFRVGLCVGKNQMCNLCGGGRSCMKHNGS